MGLTFKENCPDLRNTRVIDIIWELEKYNIQIEVYDPWINKAEIEGKYRVTCTERLEKGIYDGVLITVAHNEFKK